MDYPLQEHKLGNSQRATIALRDLVSFHADSASGGDPNPDYSQSVAANVPAEVLQVSGGEVVRGIQVEAITTFVVSIRWIAEEITERTQITVGSGPYSGTLLFPHRIHITTGRSRPRMYQLHCKVKD